MGATLIDSLDTLWLMGMRREFARAGDWVAADLDTNRCVWLSISLLGRVRCKHLFRRAGAGLLRSKNSARCGF